MFAGRGEFRLVRGEMNFVQGVAARAEIDIALTDEWPIAQALVVISAVVVPQASS